MLICANHYIRILQEYEYFRDFCKTIIEAKVISIADTMNTYIGFSIIFHKEKSIGSKSIGSYYLGSQSIGSYSIGSYYVGSQA